MRDESTSLDYARYMREVSADIAETIVAKSCQPILFVGAGLAKRYMDAPNWHELLEGLAVACPLIDKDYAYYVQETGSDLPKVGTIFSDAYRNWAWGDGRRSFDANLFSANVPKEAFFKSKISEVIYELNLESVNGLLAGCMSTEVMALRSMKPHAVITTNYDNLLETLFDDFEVVIGQRIFSHSYASIGEIYKIHGCASVPESIVVTDSDYLEFSIDRQYLSAKLLMYFVEHPLLFVGYQLADPNVRKILQDVSRMYKESAGRIPNVYFLEWNPSIDDHSYPARETVIPVEQGKDLRIKLIQAKDFDWVFEAFSVRSNIERVNTKLLRSLMARAVHLVRTDLPQKRVEIDYQMLERSVTSGEEFAKLFGITMNGGSVNAEIDYPLSITQVGKETGIGSPHHVNKAFAEIKELHGYDIKGEGNRFHIAIKPSANSKPFHKYSWAVVGLLKAYASGENLNFEE